MKRKFKEINKVKKIQDSTDKIDEKRLQHWNVKNKKYLQFDDRIDDYTSFLNDGDFEYWQPCCYDNNEEKRTEAMSLKPDPQLDPRSFEYRRQKKRILWIQNRFTVHGTPEWKDLNEKIYSIEFTREELLSKWWKR